MATHWGVSWGSSWANSWGQLALGLDLGITDTDAIQKPVDYYLVDLPQFSDRYRTVEGP